jgi:excisionase family DNA binding protein
MNQEHSTVLRDPVRARRRLISQDEAQAMLTRLRRSSVAESEHATHVQAAPSKLPWGERMLPADAPAPKLLLRVEEAAQLLSLSRKTLYDLMSRGELASLKIGGSRRIPLTALHDFVARLERIA